MTKQKRAFTLIELLVVISIIGLLTTVTMVALNNARRKARDSRRLSDVKQIQGGLELYQNHVGTYPIETTAITLGTTDADCLDGDGFHSLPCANPFITDVPADPLPPGSYTYQSSSDSLSYQIGFQTEGAVEGVDCSGGCTLTPSGIQ